MTIKIPKPATPALMRQLSKLLDGCGFCDCDEAEGDIVDHCPECCRKITAWANENFCRLALAAGKKAREAKAG